MPLRNSRCRGVDDCLGLEDRVDVGGDAPLVVRQGDRGATDDEHLGLDALGLHLVAQVAEQRQDLLARELRLFAHTLTRLSASTMTPRARNSAGA